MDLQMPGMDGYEAATRIKQIKGCEDVPIIFITAIYKEDAFVKKVAIYSTFKLQAYVLKEREWQIRETEELQKASRKLSAVLESLPVGVLISDVDEKIYQTNEEVSRILNSQDSADRDSYGEILGWWDSSGQIIKEKNGPLLRALLKGETSHNEVIKIYCFDDSPKQIFCSCSPLLGRDDQIVGAVLVIQDITESKKLKRTLSNESPSWFH